MKQQNSNNLRVTKEKTLYQLTLFNSKGLSVNCYLVEENECLTLIDTAMAEHTEAIMKVTEQIEKPLTKIILTHAHHDHVGGLDRMKQLLPDSIVYMSGREARIIEGDLQLSEDEPNTPIRGIFPKNIITKADVLLQEGDRIGSLLAMFTPGHTPGSMSFLDTRNNALIVGDAFQTEGGIAVSGVVRPSFFSPALATWNKQIALESARKIQRYNPSLLAVGHGEIIRQPLPDIVRAIAEAEQSFNQEQTK